MGITPEEIISFWQDEVGPEGWYKVDPDLDQKIRDRYLDFWLDVRAGNYNSWAGNATGTLAILIAIDQFPRNMFRGSGEAFATDSKARCIAKRAIFSEFDQKFDEPMRQFFYLPLMHSEVLADQDTCVRMFSLNMTGKDRYLHPRAHREVIRKFGRFPYRNKAMGRASTPAEIDYVKAGGYAVTLKDIQARAA